LQAEAPTKQHLPVIPQELLNSCICRAPELLQNVYPNRPVTCYGFGPSASAGMHCTQTLILLTIYKRMQVSCQKIYMSALYKVQFNMEIIVIIG